MSCKEKTEPDRDYLNKIGFPEGKAALYRGKGCEECRGTGYKGRTGLYELLLVDEGIRKLVLQKASANEIRELAVKNGMRTIRDRGWEKVLDGETTVEEVMRIAEGG